MLTQGDIQKIAEASQKNLATKKDINERFDSVDKRFDVVAKELFATRDDLEKFKTEIQVSFSNLQTSVDAYAKKADAYFQEMVMLSHKVDRHEKWLLAMAEKLGMKLEY
jgi:hypothetical protein